MKSQRQLQIGENIKRIMADIFVRGEVFNAPKSYITILEADVSPDAKNVKIYIDIFGDESLHKKIIKSLNQAVPSFRHVLSKQLTLRVVPDITFILDKTQEKAMAIEDLIEKEVDNFKSKK